MDEILGPIFKALFHGAGFVGELFVELAVHLFAAAMEQLGYGAQSPNPIIATTCTLLVMGIVVACVALAGYAIVTF